MGRELGAGGLGVVFEAIDPVLGRKVAIKLVHSRLLGTAEHTERLLREAQAMAQVSHPHVVTVFEAGRDGDDVYIAMEILHGGTLKAWLTSPRTPAEVLARGLTLCPRAPERRDDHEHVRLPGSSGEQGGALALIILTPHADQSSTVDRVLGEALADGSPARPRRRHPLRRAH